VDPNFQGKGIGKELISFVEKNKKRVWLKVLKQNPAFEFYRRLGYKIKSEEGEKYIMEKILK